MTTEATATADTAELNPEELRANLRQADAGVLVAVLAQLTGDPSVLDRSARRSPTFPIRRSVRASPTPRRRTRWPSAVIEASMAPQRSDVSVSDDPAFFARLLPVALGSDVDDEHVPLLLEQSGFQPSAPTLPRTVPIPRTSNVAIIGAGIAGITAALAAAEEGVSFEIFDRNDEVGGTWLTTTYPGIGVDTPSAYYSLSREVNPDWSNYYPQGGEYQNYLVALADKHRLREHTRFGTEVEALWWDEDRKQWEIHSRNSDGERGVSHARVVVTAAGYLNRPRWPELPGRESFKGTSVHSALWDPDAGSHRQAGRDHRGRLHRRPDRRRLCRPGRPPDGLSAAAALGRTAQAADRRGSRAPSLSGAASAVLREVAPAEVLLGHGGQQLPDHPARPRMGRQPPVHLPGQRRAAADVSGVHRPNLWRRN